MRIHFFAPSIILFSFATLALPGCFTVGDDDAPSDDDDSCNSDADCLNGQSCQNDRCVANTGSGGTGGSTGGSGGKGGSSGGTGGSTGGSGGKGGGSTTGGTGGTDGGTGGTEAGTGGTEGGTGGTGGSTGGTGGSTGGTGGSTGGTGGSTGGAGGATTTPAKFCNSLTNGGEPVTLTLEIGGVTLSALTGACAPDNACIGVPVGIDVPIALSDTSGVVSSGTYPEVPAGEEMVFFSAIDAAASLPTIEGFPGNGICSSPTSYTGTVAKFCNKLTSGGLPILLTLQLGDATVSANTGECTPIDMCLPITSGTDVPIALLDGADVVTSGTFPTVPTASAMLFQAEIDDVEGTPTITGGPYTGICGAGPAAMEGRRIEANGARKSADRTFVTADQTFEVATDSLILDAAILGVAAGPGRFLAR